MSVVVKPLKTPGEFVVADCQTWLPGVYSSEEAAHKAAQLDDNVLADKWEAALASRDPAILHLEDL